MHVIGVMRHSTHVCRIASPVDMVVAVILPTLHQAQQAIFNRRP